MLVTGLLLGTDWVNESSDAPPTCPTSLPWRCECVGESAAWFEPDVTAGGERDDGRARDFDPRESGLDAAETTPVPAWEARLGRTTADLLRRRRRMLRRSAGASAIGAVAMTVGVLVAASSGSAVVPLGTIALVFGLVVTGLIGIILAVSSATGSCRARFMAEGAAVSVLLPANPTLTAAMIAPHLRSVDDYDQWVLQLAVRPAVHGARLPRWHWSPGTVRSLLPGATAYAVRRAAGLVASIAVLVAVVIAIVLIADHGPLVRFRVLGVVLIVALLAAAGAFRLAVELRAAAEYRAGYTTLTPMRHANSRGSSWIEPDVRTGVDLVDASTCSVLRAAGAAALTVQESDRRRRTVTATAGPQAS